MNPDNPLQTDGFEFIEFTAADAEGVARLERLFGLLGFAAVARHRHRQVTLYRQGDINFVVNADPVAPFGEFAAVHGPSVCAMAWRVADAQHAYAYALKHGAQPYAHPLGAMELNIPAIAGIGGSAIYLVDRYGPKHIYEVDFVPLPGSAWQVEGAGLECIDHLTHNVARGNMDRWADFYRAIGNFRQIRYFDIEGKQTGLSSRALASPCGRIRIPINQSADDQSQIEEFLRLYHGEGIQHIALSSADIYRTVEILRANGVRFMPTPDTYYERIATRIPGHQEDLARLQRNRILIDGDVAAGSGVLLQIFTETVIGPVFFEIIQRKNNEGFGEGNFQALFESIEEDQVRRGVLQAQ
jgi:4-hydroxyphenylpyruvate dioxygenase